MITLTEINVVVVETTRNIESVVPELGETFAINWYEADFFECLVKDNYWAEATTGYYSKVLFQVVDNVINLYTIPSYADNMKRRVRSAIIDF